jgi:AP2 domain
MMPSNNRNSNTNSDKKYRGVRQRRWGRYVSEIRLPNSRQRIWLGSYDSPEKAARAFDAAAVCLRGSHREVISRLNFPDSPPEISSADGYPFSAAQIQAEAAWHANRVITTEPVRPARDIWEPSSTDREMQNENSIDWSFMDALASPVSASQAGLDYGYDFIQLPESVHQMPDDTEEDDPGSGSTLWSF